MQINYKLNGQFEHLYPVTLGDNVRLNNGTTLEQWKKQIEDLFNQVEDSDYNTIWSGKNIMDGTDTITVAKKLSECNNGWILVFKPSNSSQNYNYCYVPKGRPTNRGVKFVVGGAAGAVYSKYIVVNDSTLTGHSANVSGGNEIMELVEVVSY